MHHSFNCMQATCTINVTHTHREGERERETFKVQLFVDTHFIAIILCARLSLSCANFKIYCSNWIEAKNHNAFTLLFFCILVYSFVKSRPGYKCHPLSVSCAHKHTLCESYANSFHCIATLHVCVCVWLNFVLFLFSFPLPLQWCQ